MLPTLSPLLLLALTGCDPGSVATLTPHGVLTVDQDTLDVGAVPLDSRSQHTLVLSNRGELALDVTLSLSDPGGPFALSQTAGSLAPGERLALALWFEPLASTDPVTATLSLDPSDGETLAVALVGVADPDGDADGHTHPDLGGDDCDDADGAVYPGAAELWYDDVDQDCSGGSDHDADADGWDAEPAGRDCDDGDPDVRPTATEIWYDDVDQDCDDGSDHDADGDGVDQVPVGLDCDDSDPLIRPGVTEVWYDGTDQDCDGASDYDADHDGHDSERWSGLDCDDSDPDAAPGLAEVDDREDDDCDGLIDEDFLSAGDLLLTEIMVDPQATYDHYGQYVELLNVSTRSVALDGWRLDSESGSHALASERVLAAGERLLVCIHDDPVLNGALACDDHFGDAFQLVSPDSLTLAAGALTLDAVAWTPDWPLVSGASLNLDPGQLDSTANDSQGAWCASETAQASGDRGTPGAANDPCP